MIRRYKDKYYAKHRKKRLAAKKAYYKKNRTLLRRKMREYHQKVKVILKEEALIAYGGKRCACCGETEMSFLTLDHINGGGNKHRKRTGTNGGCHFYAWLKAKKFPKNPPLQVLCMNCQWGKHLKGVCPHQIKKL